MPVVDLLDRPTYLYAEVDRLVGVGPGTTKRWLNGYDRAGTRYEPILRISSQTTDWVTWGEFVEVRMLSEFRDQSVPTVKLRAAVERLRHRFGLRYPLAYLSPYLAAAAGELGLRENASGPDSKAELLVVTTGQLILESSRFVINSATLAVDAAGEKYATEIPISAEYPGIKVNPDRLSGQPTFEGRRVAIATIAGMIAGGERAEDIAGDYNLSLEQVEIAVSYVKKYPLAA